MRFTYLIIYLAPVGKWFDEKINNAILPFFGFPTSRISQKEASEYRVCLEKMPKTEKIMEENASVSDNNAEKKYNLPEDVAKKMLETQRILNDKIAETVKDIYFELDMWENSIYETFETAQSTMTGIELERRKLYELTKVEYKALCCLKKRAPICNCGKKIFPDRDEEPKVKYDLKFFFYFFVARSQKTRRWSRWQVRQACKASSFQRR